MQRFFPAVFHIHGDIGNFRPDDDAVLVAQIIKFLRMLVMGKAQRIRPQLPDNLHILSVMFHRQRIADTFPVLMAADAPQRITAAV